MKTQLLATTAIVGAALLFAAPALAQNVTGGGKGTKVTLTGGIDFQVGIVDQDLEGFNDAAGSADCSATDLDCSTRDYGFITNSEIAVKASGKTDAGMKWSGKIEFETDTNATGNTDEVQVTLSGSWGALVLGNEDGAEDLMHYSSEQAIAGAGSGGVDGDWQDWSNFTASGVFAREPTLAADTSDSTKASYYTPRINGVQLGVSFTPDRGASGQAPSRDNAASSDPEEFWGLGANYVQKFGDFSVAVGAVGSLADQEDPAEEDVEAWMVGAVLGFGPWKIGAAYQDNRDSFVGSGAAGTNGDLIGWDVGIGFKQGPFKAGLNYLHSESDHGLVGGLDPGENELDLVTLGGTYTLGKGLVVYLEGFWLDTDHADSNDIDNEAIGVILGTTVKF